MSWSEAQHRVRSWDRFVLERTGQGLTEYVLIIVVIAILAYLSIEMFGGKVGEAARRAGDAVTNGSCCTGHPPYPEVPE